ncbi:hypothetical protein EW145_g2751 [Phellinidium pouzarii]|uniref:tRNA-guanine(15) transglycosylase-like domain-containing protein n=1 Tax=Phellinidium pouzarii TaxID=167371 RepID=A0A4S4L9M0_9AGAM|nr:hypothetical protein EW145_g2751 [Phellinidium pouzarii]
MTSYHSQYPQYTETYPMNPSQPYAPSGGPPLDPVASGYGGDYKSPYEGDRFKPKKSVRDPVFLVLFIAQLAGFAVVSGIVLSEWVSTGGLGGGLGGGSNGANTGTSVTLNRHTVYLLLLVTAAGLILSATQLLLTRTFTRMIMHITLILSICLNIGVCVYYWITKYYSGAIIFTIIAIFSVLSYFGFRSRIPLASLLLQVVMDIANHHMSVYAVAFASLFVQAALSVWYAFTTIATYEKWTPGNPSCSQGTNCSSSKVAGLIVYETFCYLWTSQVVGNVALATLAGGPFGAWYYFGPRSDGQMPSHPTLSSFVRASTFSLGSVALGSLIVTILELIRIVLNAARQNADANGQPIEALLACCAECFVGCIESMIEYFNKYAYIEIALYGKPYIQASKDTWRLFKDRGIDALVNDSLVSITLTWGAYVVGMLASLFAYLYLRFTHPSYNTDGQYTAPVLLFAFLIGLQCSLTLSSAIEAGVSTIFVGLGEDPQILAYRAPELFEFEVIAKCPTTKARVSIMTLSHGPTMLPTFMPVATQGAIKGLTSKQMEELGITLILNNTYHLNLRPGIQVLNAAGGAHRFQVPSLLAGPRVEEAMWRSVRWFDRCIALHEKSGHCETQNLFAIVQGGLDTHLRNLCLDEMIKRRDHVSGFAVGGLSGGEAKEPRYCMGIGFAEACVDLLVCVALGIDMADCVFPTRTARFGVALTFRRSLNLRLAKHAKDFDPIDKDCPCPTCSAGTSRAFLHHLIAEETVAAHAVTQHNIVFQASLMGRARDAIMAGTFPDFLRSFFKTYFSGHTGEGESKKKVLEYPKWCVDALGSVGVDILDGVPEARVVEGNVGYAPLSKPMRSHQHVIILYYKRDDWILTISNTDTTISNHPIIHRTSNFSDHHLFYRLLGFLHITATVSVPKVITVASNALLVNYTIDDTFGDEKTGLKPVYDSTWTSSSQCYPVASANQQACGFLIDSTAASNNTWHANLNSGSMSLTFSGSAVYAYFIIPTVLMDASDTLPTQVGTHISFILDGYHVQKAVRVDSFGTVGYNVPVYANVSLSAGLHNLTIQNVGTIDDSSDFLTSVAVFDYAIYSFEDDTAPKRKLNVGALVIGLVGSVMFVGFTLMAFAFLRIRARHYANAAQIDALQLHVPTISFNGNMNFLRLPNYNEKRVDELKPSAGTLKDMGLFGIPDTRTHLRPSLRPDMSPSRNFFSSQEQLGSVSRLEAGMLIRKSPRAGIDLVLVRNSLQNRDARMLRRRSTLSRLGIRLGEDRGDDSALATEDRTTGLPRRNTVATRGVRGNEGSLGPDSSMGEEQADEALVSRLQAEIELLRAEREARLEFLQEDLPAYTESDTVETNN